MTCDEKSSSAILPAWPAIRRPPTFPPGLGVVITLRRLLCPVDFSEDSRRALEYAAALAERRGLELSVLYVEADGEARSQTDVLRRLEDELRAFVAATKNAHGTIHVGCVGPCGSSILIRQQLSGRISS